MYTRLVVPLDGTPEAEAALPLARALGELGGGELMLVRVVSEARAHAWSGETEYLAGVAAELRAAGLSASSEVRTGEVPDAILSGVYEHQADVVVMATHGRQGIQRAMMGSVAETVVGHSPVPVLLVRPGGKPRTSIRTLLVPVDGTPGGALALRSAVSVALSAGARLVLLQVTVPIPVWVFAEFGIGVGAPVDPNWDEAARESARGYVDGLAKQLRDGGLQAEGRAELGPVAPTIEAVADEVDADLIVMSTRALVGPARAFVGSTADAVVRTAHRPVLLVRRNIARPAEAAAAVIHEVPAAI